MIKVAIIGAGGFGREVYHHIMNDKGSYDRDIKFYADKQYANGVGIFDVDTIDFRQESVLIAVADPTARMEIVNRLPAEARFYKFIHSSVIILDKSVKIGEGSIICAGSILTTNIELGKHSHLNLQTTIGHDCVIGDYFTTAPGAKISGNCTIGDRVYFGTNSCVKEKISIVDDCVIGLNAGVVKDLTHANTYIGTPAKPIFMKASSINR